MKNQTAQLAKKTDAANPFLNAAILAAVALTIVPAAIFGSARYLQSRADAPAETVEVVKSSPKRSAVAERRAQQLEARRAKQAKPAQTYPEISMETVESYDYDFGMDYDADMEFNRFGMMPAPYMGGPGMMPPAYMGGPGMMPVPDRGGFNGGGRMRGAGTGFGGRFDR